MGQCSHQHTYYLPAPLCEAMLLVELCVSEITSTFKIQQQIQHSETHFYPLLNPFEQERPEKDRVSHTDCEHGS